ncbi:hypothetical protein PENSPDRAFT_420349 [Peniophora sp. CONT]|nr:hypothetical protein PENSPDRAFT_420349 [Peniophora sp. CONT]
MALERTLETPWDVPFSTQPHQPSSAYALYSVFKYLGNFSLPHFRLPAFEFKMIYAAFTSLVTVALVSFMGVQAVTHTITFANECGRGTPTLVGSNGAVLSTGAPFTINGPLTGATAYLQTGSCGSQGENCCTLDINDNGAGPVCTTQCPATECSANGGNLAITFCD